MDNEEAKNRFHKFVGLWTDQLLIVYVVLVKDKVSCLKKQVEKINLKLSGI